MAIIFDFTHWLFINCLYPRVEEGEQSSKYFLRLESDRQTYNCITALKDRNDVTVDTDKDILDVAKTFYSDLYTSTTVNNADMDLAFDSLTPENVFYYSVIRFQIFRLNRGT